MTTETAPVFKPESIGVAGDPVEFEVTKERIAAYAAATNDQIAPHAAGEIAPPVFAIVPAFQAAGMASLTVIPGELLVSAYTSGWFPMAGDDGVIRWYSPDPRGIIPLDIVGTSTSLAIRCGSLLNSRG